MGEGDDTNAAAPTPTSDVNANDATATEDVSVTDFTALPHDSTPESGQDGSQASEQTSREGTPPPLPPRPKTLHSEAARSLRVPGISLRPPLQSTTSKTTTALSLQDVHTQSHDGKSLHEISKPGGLAKPAYSPSISGGDDSTSIRSFAPTLEAGADVDSVLGDVLGNRGSPAWTGLGPLVEGSGRVEEDLFPVDLSFNDAFQKEFEEVEEMKADGSNEEAVLSQWKSKLKHFLIISSAGKPIWSRHGSDQIISNYMGVVQTIISFYQGAKDELKGFVAGDVRFVVVSKGSLNLVAISRLGESDPQLRSQLEALYMQILSTLTLPSMEHMFKTRASTDLRRPLQGTEVLLSALADGFTRGSPSTLLSALECLKLRKTHRQAINNTLLKTKSPNLLYGLIVAGGRLVSVVRPKKHSLHPGDLQLIFNMLFEAGSVKAGGGENWIPLCLPGFNNTGYLYMFVSFLKLENVREEVTERPSTSSGSEDEVAILLISANKESFFELRQMRDDLVDRLEENNGLALIRQAVQRGRPSCTDIIPGTVLRHFLYKSRGNVQFFMPSFSPYFDTPLDRRRLLTTYASLHSHLHNKPTHLKIHHSTTPYCLTIAWGTPLFELYAIAPATTSRQALAHAANRLIQWIRREEERVFIIGGAVF